MQRFDSRDEILRQRHRAFAHHPAVRVLARERRAVEAKPGGNGHQATVTVHEIGDPQLTGAQVDGDFAVRAAPEHLPLDRPVRLDAEDSAFVGSYARLIGHAVCSL